MEDVDVLAGKLFGPNIKRILKKFTCVVIKNIENIEDTFQFLEKNMDRILEEKNKKENRKPVVITA